MQSSANYNAVAFFYDALCQLVFGQTIRRAQTEALHFIPPNAHVLIVGGGTGWILEEIANKHPSGLQITYIDSSYKMIEQSKKRNTAHNTVHFIHESIESINLPSQQYDVLLTPFLFDNFSQATSALVFKKLNASLKNNGHWLYSDFQVPEKSNNKHKITLQLMYYFFRFTCNIEANKLPVMNNYFLLYEIIRSCLKTVQHNSYGG